MIEATREGVTPPHEPGDPVLVREARNGSEDAFRRLVERHMPAVLAVARRKVGQGTLAEEIAQEVFVRLFRSLDAIKPGVELGPWLHRVATNLSIDALRRRRRFADHMSLDSLPPGREPRADSSSDDAVLLKETRRMVWSALGRLDPDRRDVVILRYVAGWSYAEIGRALDLAPGTVASRLHRALEALGRLIGTPPSHAGPPAERTSIHGDGS